MYCVQCGSKNKSFPSRGRGLKFTKGVRNLTLPTVVPLAGTWIEILPAQH